MRRFAPHARLHAASAVRLSLGLLRRPQSKPHAPRALFKRQKGIKGKPETERYNRTSNSVPLESDV